MKTFKATLSTEKSVSVLKLEGHFNEDASLGPVPDGDSVIVDFQDLKGINSVGIRIWVEWAKTASSSRKIIFRNCPKVVVDQMNMFSGFAPTGAIIESFYVPYVSDGDDDEKQVLFRRGKEFIGEKLHFPKVVDRDGKPMEIDVMTNRYFSFLKSQKP